MAQNVLSSDQVTASMEVEDLRNRSHTLAEWNRVYVDLAQMSGGSGSAKAEQSKGQKSSPKSSANSGASSSHDDTSRTTASRHHKDTSRAGGHPIPMAARGSDGFTSSQADGSGGDGTRGDGSGSGSDSPHDEGFTKPKDMTRIANNGQPPFDVERQGNITCMSQSHSFDVEGFNAAHGIIHSSTVGASGSVHSSISNYLNFDRYQEFVEPNYPIHGCGYQASGSQSRHRVQSVSEDVTALRYQSFAQHSFEKLQPTPNRVMPSQLSAAHLGLARSPLANIAMSKAGLARLINSVPPQNWDSTTTVMLRDIPVKYNRQMLLKELEHVGFLDGINLLYLPIVRKLVTNRGYAFINFISPNYAWAFKYVYEGRSWAGSKSARVATVIQSNKQGFEANYSFYSREWTKDPEARPWINAKLISGTSPPGFDSVAEYEPLGRNMDTRAMFAPVNAYHTESFDDLPTEVLYL